MKDRLNGMRVFAQVVEAKSFSAAADKLGMSKSVASRHVSALERSLSVKLLNRSTRKLGLTEAGTVFYEHCARIVQEAELAEQRVALEGVVLKPNMVVAGQKSPKQSSAEEVAEKTLRCLKATVPSSVPGIAFLSGGQSDEEATAHLDLMNKIGNLPWKLTFSYGRALQAAPQKAWSGKNENVAAAQRVFAHRAQMNGLASKGQWKQDLEKKAA